MRDKFDPQDILANFISFLAFYNFVSSTPPCVRQCPAYPYELRVSLLLSSQVPSAEHDSGVYMAIGVSQRLTKINCENQMFQKQMIWGAKYKLC
jgi:hypothetical protein